MVLFFRNTWFLSFLVTLIFACYQTNAFLSSSSGRGVLSRTFPPSPKTLNSVSKDVETKIVSEKSFGENLEEFLTDCSALDTCRMVVVGRGAILEAEGKFHNIRYADTPKGRLATFTSVPKNEKNKFELHLRVNEVKEVQLTSVVKFEKELKIIRFKDENGEILLSSILSGEESEITTQGKAWNALISKWEDGFKV